MPVGAGLSGPARNVMRLRRAVLEIPSKSLVSAGLLLYKNRSPLSPSKSTLPGHLNKCSFQTAYAAMPSFRINTYKKTGHAVPTPGPQVCQLVTTNGCAGSTHPSHSLPFYPQSFHTFPHGFRHPGGVWPLYPLHANFAVPSAAHPELYGTPDTGHGPAMEQISPPNVITFAGAALPGRARQRRPFRKLP